MRAKHGHLGNEIIQSRIEVLRRFEQWRKPECLDVRRSGDGRLWEEYDGVRQEIHTLLRRAQSVADELRAAVTTKFGKRQESSVSVSSPPPQSTGYVMKQREMMRSLVAEYGRNEARVCHEYALAEERGEVQRRRNGHGLPGDAYAHALWRDGIRKGWL